MVIQGSKLLLPCSFFSSAVLFTQSVARESEFCMAEVYGPGLGMSHSQGISVHIPLAVTESQASLNCKGGWQCILVTCMVGGGRKENSLVNN